MYKLNFSSWILRFSGLGMRGEAEGGFKLMRAAAADGEHVCEIKVMRSSIY